MDAIDAEVRRWGNSLGVIIPASAVRDEDLKPNDRIRIRIDKVRHPHASSFGSLKGAAINPQRMKDELRRVHAF